MFNTPVGDPAELTKKNWSDFEPYYRDLLERPLGPESVERFLADWSKISEALDEAYSRLNVAVTVNTADKEAERLYFNFLDNIYPPAEEAEQKVRLRFLELGVEPEGFGLVSKRMRTEVELFRQENIPLMTQEQKLGSEYDKIVGAQTVEWEGKEVTLTQLRPVYREQDRTLREKAWRSAAERRLADRDEIGRLWGLFMDLRLRMARNAGFDDYRSFRWKQMTRFDYTPRDCFHFHEAIEKAVTPAAGAIYENRRKRLGLNALRPWDLEVDPENRPPLNPFKEAHELISGVGEMFRRVDHTLYGHFRTMADEGYLDLENRKNKAPGGYCTEFPVSRRPFIFMNAVGIHDDVQTLLHESGHAFHAFERNDLPYYPQRHVAMEFAEVASMSMELLASPYFTVSDGGFYSPEDAARARIEHLERCIVFWPYMAQVDAFQHWVYENPEIAVQPAECDKAWRGLSDRFMPWFDWTGLEDARDTGWQQKLHIHVAPFYYVEYGLAQLGAAQIWRNSLQDHARAVAQYRRALALGGTVSLPALFQAAGASFAFDAETLRDAVNLMEKVMRELTEGSPV